MSNREPTGDDEEPAPLRDPWADPPDTMEERVRRYEGRLTSFMESSPNQIIVTDRDLVIQFVNRYGPGYSPERVLGVSLTDFLPEPDVDRVRATLVRVIEEGVVERYEVPPNPGVYDQWFAVDAGPLRERGEITGVILNIVDMSDHVRLQSRLLVADRLASQGTLAASVAHEINNPLTYLLANLQRLSAKLARSGADEKTRGWLAAAEEGAERIRNVVRDLSSLSRPNDARAHRVDVRPILQSSIRMARSELQHRAQVALELGEVPRVAGDESRLGQVFLNILINAAQAIPVGHASENFVTVHTRTSHDGWAVIEIRDTGVGVSESLAKRIFEPFVTTKDAGSGTGLGLYVCASIVQSLSGRLSVEANETRGSCFRIELPPAAGSDARPRTTAELRSVGSVRILTIDDEEGVLEFLKDALMEHEVTSARSGREALEILDSSRFDLIFCDLIMPEVSGMDVFAAIQRERPELAPRFVFMTGGAFTPAAQSFLETCGRPLLEKPFAIDDVLSHVADALARGV